MADGKIEFEVAANIKQLRKDLHSSELEYKKFEKKIASLEYDNRVAEGKKAKYTAERLRTEHKNLQTAIKERDAQKETVSAIDQEIKRIDSLSPKMRKLWTFYRKWKDEPGVGKGLIAANAKNAGVSLKDIEYYNSLYKAKWKQEEILKSKEAKVSRKKETISTLQKGAKHPAKEVLENAPKLEKLKWELEQSASEAAKLSANLKIAMDELDRVEKIEALKKALFDLNKKINHNIFKGILKGFKLIGRPFKKFKTHVSSFYKRIKNAVLQGILLRPIRELFFAISQAMASAAKQNLAFRASLANLKGTLFMALAPAFNALIPILTKVIDLVSTGITYVSSFISALFGLKKATVDAGKELYKMSTYGEKSLASWDTIQQLQTPTIRPTFEQDFSKAEEAMGEINKFVSEGKWAEIGAILAEKVNKLIAGLNSEKIGEAIGKVINGFLDLAINFVQNLEWDKLGAKIKEGLKALKIDEIFKKVIDLVVETLKGGVKLVEGITGWDLSWMVDSLEEVRKTAKNLIDLLSGKISFSDFWNELSGIEKVALLVAGAIGAIKIALDIATVVNTAKGLLKTLGSAFGLLKGDAGGAGGAIDGVRSALNFSALVTPFKTAITALCTHFGTLLAAIKPVAIALAAIAAFKGAEWLLDKYWGQTDPDTGKTRAEQFVDDEIYGLGQSWLPPAQKEFYERGQEQVANQPWAKNPGLLDNIVFGTPTDVANANAMQNLINNAPMNQPEAKYPYALGPNGTASSAPSNIVIEVDGTQIARTTLPYFNAEVDRIGGKTTRVGGVGLVK